MKKLFYVGALSALLLTACGGEEKAESKEEAPASEQTKAKKEPVAAESKYPFPSASPIGNATIKVSTPAGDSSNGNVPTLFVDKDDAIVQIGVDYENFDGNLETFVYINKAYYSTEHVGELAQSSLDLSEDNLKPSEYTVTAVQFTDNDPTKEPINLTQTKFKIEEKTS
ncbi:hypothetical protein [Lysinibacillus sp. NPDC086135]|uniref:hypothetical protein n=1 Tax=Lysinibacillus sp. NPDC086135 TaxID=3364130 RepID=UPI0038199FF0